VLVDNGRKVNFSSYLINFLSFEFFYWPFCVFLF
jgi:hypothetical protein